MKNWVSALVYTALAICAIAVVTYLTLPGDDATAQDTPALASTDGGQIAELEALREGLMRKLVFHGEAQAGSDVTFTDPDGGSHSLADYHGKYVVLNFWATWCAPCRKEMGSLDRLQAQMRSDRFEVVPVATSRNPLPAITRFFDEEGITNLPILLDPQSTLAADFGAMSLPVTVILNPEGQEIARMIGDAEWDSASAIAILTALTQEN